MLRGSETILINWILNGYNMQHKGFEPLTSFTGFSTYCLTSSLVHFNFLGEKSESIHHQIHVHVHIWQIII